MLQGITGVLQGCCRGVAGVLQECARGGAEVLHEITRVLQGMCVYQARLRKTIKTWDSQSYKQDVAGV